MNIIETIKEIVKGKRYKRICWQNGYIQLGHFGEIVDQDFKKFILIINDVIADDWEQYH